MRIPNPPTIHELLDDPVYRAYVKQVPRTTVLVAGEQRPHPALTTGQPWQVWARTTEGKWKTGRFCTYHEAWSTLVKAYRSPTVDDVVLVSRRVFYGPPGHWEEYKVKVPVTAARPTGVEVRERWTIDYHWDAGLSWCARCRRPTSFRKLHPTHHALRHQPALTDDDPYRCVFCGIRRAALPPTYTLVGE